MEWDASKGKWLKECITCKNIFSVEADKWDDASVAFREFFYEYRVKTGDRSGIPVDDLHPRCKECHSHSVHKRNYNGKTRDQLLREQNGLCAICYIAVSFVDNTAVIDHDHKTREIRGVLCNKCNWGLGSFQDNQVFLYRAIEYLKKHK